MKPISRILVEQFYYEVWNKADEQLAHEILTQNFQFRGSLGAEYNGPVGFISYMRKIHTALADYECIIENLINDGDKAAARMLFRGVHQNTFLGFEATGKKIQWAGAAFFQFRGEQISQLWVLGDLDSLRQQLKNSASSQ